MKRRTILPHLRRFALRSFRPIFNADAELRLSKGTNIVLGGNGLGKTTIMQAIVYGMAGGTDEIEDEKSKRWDHHYFQQRLSADSLDTALVEVAFDLGGHTLELRRGFRHPRVLAFKTDNEAWIEDEEQANASFQQALDVFGGYENAKDFTYVVHRLLYLPESRRLIAWDTDTQLTLQVLLNQDISPDFDIDVARQELLRLDSARRHKHVDVGKIQQKLERLRTARGRRETTKADTETSEAAKYQEAVADLQRSGRERLSAERDLNRASVKLSDASNHVEELQEKVDEVEAMLVQRHLSEQELELSLALQKLVEFGLCPACGTRQPNLQAAARQHVRTHSCTLCGSNITGESDVDLSTLRSRMSEKIRAKTELENEWRSADARVQHLRALEADRQRIVNEIRFDQPVLSLETILEPVETRKELTALSARLIREEQDLAAQIDALTKRIEGEYGRFRVSMAARAAKLKETYRQYATDFLGTPCELSEIETDDRLVVLMRFVPKFNDVERPTPESCSEAQRFFLDIAFRLALIDIASDPPKGAGTFLCETPETALDLTYVENVVTMLARFAKEGHSSVFSVNIQEGGIGQQLLSTIPKKQRASHVLNLIEIGNLSAVQEQRREKIDRAVKKMLE